MARLNLSLADIVDRIIVTLPGKFTRSEDSELYKFMQGIAKIFEVSSNQVDDLFDRTAIACTGQYLDTYVTDLINYGRETDETDDEYRERYYKFVFTYNSTKEGMRAIVYDTLGYYPTCLVDKQRCMFWDAEFYWNDINGDSVWASGSAPYVGYIVLQARPSSGDLEKLCKLINDNKAAGVQIYLRFPQYNFVSSDDYAYIAEIVTSQEHLTYNRGQPFGFFWGNGDVSPYIPYWDDATPIVYGDPDRDDDEVIVFLADDPGDVLIEELCDQLEANKQGADVIKIWVPTD